MTRFHASLSPSDTGDRLGNEHDTGSDRPLSTRPYSVSVNFKHPSHSGKGSATNVYSRLWGQYWIIGYHHSPNLGLVVLRRWGIMIISFLVHIHSNNICCNFVHQSISL